MKTPILIATGLACALLVLRASAAPDVVADWYAAMYAAQQTSHQDAGGRTRANAILRSALDTTRHGIKAGANLEAATAQAAYSVMTVLYSPSRPALDAQLAASLARVDDTPAAIAAGREWGKRAAGTALAEQNDAVLLNAGSFSQAAKAPEPALPVPGAEASQPPTEAGRYNFSILAGSTDDQGYVDGAGPAARFDLPGGIAVDAADNVYVSEQRLNTIRKISPAGVVTTLAGTAGPKGSQDGMGPAAQFNMPWGLTVDSTGNVYVADRGNRTIRKIDPAGNVTTVAGQAGKVGVTDGSRSTALLNVPISLALADDGNLFFSDNLSIRKLAPDGAVSTLPLEIGLEYTSLTYLPMWFSAVGVDRTGNIYAIITNQWDVADVLKFTRGLSGHYVGQALLFDPKVISPLGWHGWAEGLGFDGDDNLYITYSGGNPVVVYTPTGETRLRNTGDGADAIEEAALAVDVSGRLFTLPGTNWSGSDETVRVASFDPNAGGPIIQHGPDNHFAYVGDPVQFAVVATTTATTTYQWYFNSVPVKGANRATLELGAAQMSDAGKYYVTVSDSSGSATSGIATLKVELQRAGVTSPPVPPASAGSTNGSSGGGSFEGGSALALLALLAAAALRRTRGPAGCSNVDALEHRTNLAR